MTAWKGPVLEALNRCLDRSLSFVAFRSPGGPIRLWAQLTPDPGIIDATALNNAGRAFVIAPFYSDSGPTRLIRPEVELLFDRTISPPDLSQLGACVGGPQDVLPVASGLSQEGYALVISEAKKAFEAGTMKKVVLARTVEASLDTKHLADLLLAAEATYAEAFVCLLHTPVHGTWIGASPERLLIAAHGRVLIDALAGTMPAEDAPNEAARWGAKERDEQELVTLDVLRKLRSLGLRNLTMTGPLVKRAGQVAHLHTLVTAETGDTGPGMLASLLHPTPAICGEPVIEAQTFIRAHESHLRTLYAGYWGPWWGDGRAELHVNIRCMEVLEDRAVIHVGAGITSGSIAEEEWAETELKARTWLNLIEGLPGSRVS
ncbi:MAG: chorismate-binding protein [Flavobacteriales bacterium]